MQSMIPYQDGEIFSYLRQHCLVLEFEYLEDSIYLKVEMHPSMISRYSKYILKN